MLRAFFSLSDHTMRFRRNLLFVSALCFIHFAVTSLSTLKILDVTFPNSFLAWALPACLMWFAFNYFFHLYSEYTEWRAVHMEGAGIASQIGEPLAMIPEIAIVTDNHIKVTAQFRTEG